MPNGFAPDPIYLPTREQFVDPETHVPSRIGIRYLETVSAVTQTLQAQGYVLEGAHATRLQINPNTVPASTLFVETDRHVIYLGGTTWTYLAGVMVAPRIGAPIDLDTPDVGFRLWVTDFAHLVVWNGVNWLAAPGTVDPYTIGDFTVAPTPAEWAVCDGATQTQVLTIGAALGFTLVTPPNLAGSVLTHKYLRR